MIAGVIDKLSFWHSGMDPEVAWPVLDPANPPQLVSGTQLYLCVWWINTGGEAFRGRIHLDIIKPDTTRETIPAVLYQDQVANPTEGFGIGFNAVTLLQGGTYKAEVMLESVSLYCCPYCTECFDTYDELVAHVQTVHPGERIPIEIEWG